MTQVVDKVLFSFNKLLEKSREDIELAQSVTRLIVSISMLLTLSLFSLYQAMISLLFVHMIYAGINLYYVYKHKSDAEDRKLLALFIDITLISIALYLGDIDTLFLYPLYLWVIMGNGIRYGRKYMYAGLGIGVVTFFLATFTNPSWDEHHNLSYSLMAGMGLLALFFNKIINQLHALNASLDKKVLARTEALEHELYHDRLTGLKNRDALDRDCKAQFSPLLLVDIDKFGVFNELYGVEAGNQILQAFAGFVTDFAQTYAYEAYRIYGDGMILKSKDSDFEHEKLFHDITKFLDDLANHKIILEVEGEEIVIEVSATIAISMEKKYTLEKANIALKHARLEQKDFLAYYHALNTEKELKDTLYWTKEIKKALQEENMIPVFQPIVNKEGDTLKYEVLTRLKQVGINGTEYISPFHFLDIAIKTKQYKHITRSVIRKSFEIMKDKEVDFSINLLFADIKDTETMRYLKEQIVASGVGSRLVLEIVESEDIKDYKLLKNVIGNFRELGVRIAIDDFGSGFSNYAYILDIAPDYLKIDGSLIKEIDVDDNAYKLVGSIQTLASSLGIKTIAEYIHSESVFDTTKKLGIDEFQGYYFSKPLDVEAFEKREALAVMES